MKHGSDQTDHLLLSVSKLIPPLQFGQCQTERVFFGDIFPMPGVPVLLPAGPHVYLDDDDALESVFDVDL